MGCHYTDKKRLEEKDCKQPKALVLQIPRQDEGWQEVIVFIYVCGRTLLPTDAQNLLGQPET